MSNNRGDDELYGVYDAIDPTTALTFVTGRQAAAAESAKGRLALSDSSKRVLREFIEKGMGSSRCVTPYGCRAIYRATEK